MRLRIPQCCDHRAAALRLFLGNIFTSKQTVHAEEAYFFIGKRRTMQRYRVIIAGMFALLVSACGVPSATSGMSNQGGIQIQAAWVRAVTVDALMTTTDMPMQGDHGAMASTGTAMNGMDMSSMPANGVTGAAYMTLRNTGSTPDQLMKITTDVADAVEIHNTTTDNNVAQMRPVAALDVPANGQVDFKPGGYHIMLINVKRTLKVGDTVPLTLTFQRAGTVQVTAEVRES